MSSAPRVLALAAVALLVGACKQTSTGVERADASAAPSTPTESERTVLDIGVLPGNCTRVATWPVLDFRAATRALTRVDGAPVEERDVVEVLPSDYLRVRGQELRSAWHLLPEDLAPPRPEVRTLDLRLVKGVAKGVNVALNGRSLGLVRLGKELSTMASLSIPEGVLVPGRNELSLRATGKLKSGEVAFGVDDVRVREGKAPSPNAEGGASSHAVAGQALHGLALKPGAALRCYVALPDQTSLRLNLGQQGPGDGALEVWSTEDRGPAELLARIPAAKEGSPAQPVVVALPNRGGSTGPRALELRAVSSSTQGRLVLGAARLTSVAAPTVVAPNSSAFAKSAVVVVWGSLPKGSLAIYGGRGTPTPALDSIAARGLVGDHMRASSTYSQGSFGSMLTGRSPLYHGAKDSRSILSEKLSTVAEAAREAGVRTAYFTANPTTTRLLGFGRGWDVVEEILPGGPIPATRVFERAINFVRSHAEERFLVVIHARGGHPPWDADPTELANLPPKEYSGAIDPRSAGEWLEQVRRGRRPNRYTDADRARVTGLSELSIAHHDAALGLLLESVQAARQDASTAWLVVGDIPPNESAPLPFGEGEFPDEPQLELPLVFSSARRSELRGVHADWRSSSEDVATTVLQELGLKPPASFEGIDLLDQSANTALANTRVRVAMADKTSALRIGDRVLQAKGSVPGRLCDLALESSCVSDVRATYPVSAATLEFAFAPWLSQASTLAQHPVTIEAAEAAARTAWGLP